MVGCRAGRGGLRAVQRVSELLRVKLGEPAAQRCGEARLDARAPRGADGRDA